MDSANPCKNKQDVKGRWGVKVEVGQDHPPWGMAEGGEGFPWSEGATPSVGVSGDRKRLSENQMGMWLASLPHTWALVSLLESEAWPQSSGGPPLAVGTMEAWEWGNGGGKVDTRWNWHPWGVLGEREGFPCSEGPIHGAGISRDGEKPLGDWKGTELVTSPPAQAPASLLTTSFSFFLIYFIFLTLFYFFILHYCSLSSLLPFFLCWWHGLQGLSSQAGGWTWAPVVGAPSPNYWTNRKPQTTGVISVSAPRGPHLCTKTHFHPTSY